MKRVASDGYRPTVSRNTTGSTGGNNRNNPPKGKSTTKKWIKGLAITLCVLLVACIGGVVWMYSMYRNIQDDPWSVFEKTQSGGAVITDSQNQEHVKTDKIVNVLLLGIDSNAEREADHRGYRSDTMILVSMNFNDNTINMISMPRDAYVEVDKLDAKTGEVISTGKNKINSAYAFGGGPNHFGAQNAVNCMKKVLSCNGKFDIDIDYYASIDMDGLPKLADALDGVEVVLEQNLDHIGKKGETVTITSKNIDEYVRNRYTGGGDGGRGSRQVDFVIAAIKKIQAMGAIQAAPKLFNQASYIKTNMGIDQVAALAAFADGFDFDNLSRFRVPSTSDNIKGASVEIIDEQALYEYMLEQFYDLKE